MSDSEQHRPPSGEQSLRYPLPTGTRVDHYVIREVLGAGGFGITYLAEHEGLGKLYALKEYFPHAVSYRHGRSVVPTSNSDGTYRWGLERFVTEARALAKFKHPAIVDVASIFEANGTAYIVLDYEAGVDMVQWLRDLGRPPTQEELDRLLIPLLDALDEVHRHHMMHRDISPDNLLIREDGRPVLIDFGSARESIRGRARALSAIVKHGYSPPEQYSSRPELQGPWTDIYAMSATLYRAISGKLPPDATERLVRDDILPLSRLARLPYRASFLDAVDRGLHVKIEDRPQTIVEWREMIFGEAPLLQPVRGLDVSSAGGSPNNTSRRDGLSSRPPLAAERAASSGPGARPQNAGAASVRPSLAPLPHEAGSRRVSGGSSIPKSERPDLSWLDEADDAALLDQELPHEDKRDIGQSITYAILGLMGGAVLGGMLSIALASIISTECFADKCILKYLTACSSIGAVIGVIAGVRFARTRPTDPPPEIGR